jgi:dTDP-4-dehydrorhamnose reductase
VASGEIDRPAERPAFSALGCGRLLREQGLALRSWNLAIAAFVADEGGEI